LLSAPGGDLLAPVAAIAEVVRAQDLGPLPATVVCLAPSGDPASRYLAIASLDLPRVVRLITGRLAPWQPESHEVPWYALTVLTIDQRPVWLLNLAALEGKLLTPCA
jgi:hypothetical protein